MTDFIQGENRFQVILLPERLDNQIDVDNPILVVNAFVHHLNQETLGVRTALSDTDRPEL